MTGLVKFWPFWGGILQLQEQSHGKRGTRKKHQLSTNINRKKKWNLVDNVAHYSVWCVLIRSVREQSGFELCNISLKSDKTVKVYTAKGENTFPQSCTFSVLQWEQNQPVLHLNRSSITNTTFEVCIHWFKLPTFTFSHLVNCFTQSTLHRSDFIFSILPVNMWTKQA